jgi:Holliday junction resolvase-like predicted endonuclease
VVVARRLRTVAAELDLVVREGDVLACVEVKSGRAGPRFVPGDRLDGRRRGRLRRAARLLARRTGRRVRVDLVEVRLPTSGGRLRVVHHRNLQRPLAGPPARGLG